MVAAIPAADVAGPLGDVVRGVVIVGPAVVSIRTGAAGAGRLVEPVATGGGAAVLSTALGASGRVGDGDMYREVVDRAGALCDGDETGDRAGLESCELDRGGAGVGTSPLDEGGPVSIGCTAGGVGGPGRLAMTAIPPDTKTTTAATAAMAQRCRTR